MSKLTIMEKRAKAACDQIMEWDKGSIDVVWRRSPTWGKCPSILWRGKKAAYASGCGYCKLSAVLSEYLRWLVPDVGRCNGAGVSSVQECLEKNGWILTRTYEGPVNDGFELRRK